MKLSDPRLLPAAVFGTVLAVGAVASFVGGRETAPEAPASVSAPPSPPPTPLDPTESALVAPLVVGADLDGFEVRDIRGVRDGVMRVVAVNGKATVYLQIALGSDDGPLAPAKTGRYAVFYSVNGATPQDGERLAKALARVVEANAAKPAPTGMTVFKARSKPGTPL